MQHLLAACEGTLKPNSRPFEGKSFYLDEVKSRSVSALTSIISRLGGKVESFLHKEVNMVITANRDALAGAQATSGKLKARDPTNQSKDGPNSENLGTPGPLVYGSRGRALLEKAIRNKEKSQAGVLVSARSWGVKIVFVDVNLPDFLKSVQRLTSDTGSQKSKKNEKKPSNSSGLNVMKAGHLKASFVKVEDSSRKYRPVYAQSLSFPMISYTRRFSPFENPAPVQACKIQEENLSKDKLRKCEEPINSQDKLSEIPSPRFARKKKSLGYCECCQVNYKDQDEHLQSEIHQRFIQDAGNYAVVDQLVAKMTSVFTDLMKPCDDTELMRLSTDSLESQFLIKNELENHQTNFSAADFCLEFWGNADAVKEHNARVSESPAEPQEPEEPFKDTQVQTSDNTKHVEGNCVNILTSEPNLDVSRETKSIEVQTRSSRAPLQERTFEDKVADASPTLKKVQNEFSSKGSSMLASSCSALPRFSILPLNFSNEENPRKRSRSFRLSPKVSKIRKTCLMSEPANLSNNVNVAFSSLIYESLKCQVGCPVTNNSVKFEPQMADQDLPRENTTISNMEEHGFCQSNEQKPFKNEGSSELGPPELYPFYLDDNISRPLYTDSPKLVPCLPLSSPKTSHPCTGQSQASSASLLSQTLSSVCIEPTLIPNATFSPASSESDWDSGLLSRLAPIQLQPMTGQCELDLGLLLQRSCTEVQDGSYTSRLCSVLQAEDVVSSSNVYKSIETLEWRIISSLGV